MNSRERQELDRHITGNYGEDQLQEVEEEISMKKIVINADYGGFSLSLAAVKWMAEHGDETALAYLKEYEGKQWYGYRDVERDDPILVAAVETLGGEAAGGDYATLKVVEIPDDVVWQIDEYDGMEWVAEVHRTWS